MTNRIGVNMLKRQQIARSNLTADGVHYRGNLFKRRKPFSLKCLSVGICSTLPSCFVSSGQIIAFNDYTQCCISSLVQNFNIWFLVKLNQRNNRSHGDRHCNNSEHKVKIKSSNLEVNKTLIFKYVGNQVKEQTKTDVPQGNTFMKTNATKRRRWYNKIRTKSSRKAEAFTCLVFLKGSNVLDVQTIIILCDFRSKLYFTEIADFNTLSR